MPTIEKLGAINNFEGIAGLIALPKKKGKLK
jgi:hypothetical protein